MLYGENAPVQARGPTQREGTFDFPLSRNALLSIYTYCPIKPEAKKNPFFFSFFFASKKKS